jgi:hypothetical protein
LGIYSKGQCRREKISPLVELMLEFGDNVGEPGRVESRACVVGVKELVDAI